MTQKTDVNVFGQNVHTTMKSHICHQNTAILLCIVLILAVCRIYNIIYTDANKKAVFQLVSYRSDSLNPAESIAIISWSLFPNRSANTYEQQWFCLRIIYARNYACYRYYLHPSESNVEEIIMQVMSMRWTVVAWIPSVFDRVLWILEKKGVTNDES